MADRGPGASGRADEKADRRGGAGKRDASAKRPRKERGHKRQQPQQAPTEAAEQQSQAAKETKEAKKKPKALSPAAKKQKHAEPEPDPAPRAYRVGYRTCAEHSPRELSREYGGRPDDYASIAEAYAEKTATERSRQAAYAGCYDALVEEWG